MRSDPARLPDQLDLLERLYGPPTAPPPKKALDWILWENAAYLVPDERRAAAYRALKKRTRLSARGILGLPREELLELARLGGMLAERRVEKLLSIATIVQEEFDGKLETALELPLPKARRALKRFPGTGDPGAEKILLSPARTRSRRSSQTGCARWCGSVMRRRRRATRPPTARPRRPSRPILIAAAAG